MRLYGRPFAASDHPVAGGGDCPFCRIARGELDARIVLEDERTLAFLDRRPLFAGHTLLIPREHHRTLLEMPDGLAPELFANTRLLARAMEEGLGAEGSFIAINNNVSQSVPHFHVHVVPRRRKDGLRGFFWPRNPYRDDAHAAKTQASLRSTLERLRRTEGSTS